MTGTVEAEVTVADVAFEYVALKIALCGVAESIAGICPIAVTEPLEAWMFQAPVAVEYSDGLMDRASEIERGFHVAAAAYFGQLAHRLGEDDDRQPSNIPAPTDLLAFLAGKVEGGRDAG